MRFCFYLLLFFSLAPIYTATAKTDKFSSESFTTDKFFEAGQKVFPDNFQTKMQEYLPDRASEAGKVTKDYPVGPGDQFLVNFWGRVQDNLILSINNENKLFIPRIGVIDTASLTYEGLVKALSEKIRSSMKNVNFNISLYKARQFNVYVLGSVVNPGPIGVQATTRASEAVRRAGGTLPTGSTQFIEIRRQDKILRLDLISFTSFGDFSHNPYLSDGDVVFVPVLSDFVTVTGAVVQPSTFEIKETRDLREVIERLGGLSIYADRSAPIQLSRLLPDGNRVKYEVITNKSEAKRSGNEVYIDELVLQNGDEIFVPSARILIPSKSQAVFVTGEVKNPGAKNYMVAASVEEYIGAAGGLTDRANFSSAVVYKADGSEVALSTRMTVEPGDTIHIPEKTFKFWQDHLFIVNTFISLATSIIVLSGR